MKLINRDAEKHLLEKANSISPNPQNWRCIYINFAGQEEQYSDGLRTYVVTNIIKDMLDDDEGYIYLCEDGDVFILFRGQVGPILDKLGEQFRDLGKSEGAAHPEDEIYSVLDLSKYWQVFITLCRSKVPNKPAVAAPLAAQPKQAHLPEADAVLFAAAVRQRPLRKRPLVLVVEDDPFTRRLVTGTLKADYDLAEAGDGVAAIRAYEAMAPDAVFLDIELPDVNGHVLLKKMRALDKQSFIVMLSANSMKENVLAALEQGAQGFVTKPFAKEKLLHYLNLCQMARQRDHQSSGAAV